MGTSQTKKFSVFLFLALLIVGFAPGGLKAQGACCFGEVNVGVDFLYWSPCVGDLHYAVVGEDDDIDVAECVKTKYICTDWEPGVRAYIKVDDLWCGFNGGIAFTYYDADAKSSTSTDILDSVRLSTSLPETDPDIFGNEASGHWDLEYYSLDAYLSYPLNVSCNPCMEVEAFSGIKWVSFCEERKDEVEDTVGSVGARTTFKRDLDAWGIGPMFGFKSAYTLCDCIKVFGLIETSLIVGESESKDHLFTESTLEVELSDRTFKSCDECVCFPGLHLMSGISYETCLCDMEIGLHVGWEYVQWINAPTFPFYENGEDGVRSASSESNLTLQGIFAGINISF